MNAHRNQQLFLANEKNNVQFIDLLSHYLRLDGHAVIQSKGDADSQIVSAAIALASDGKHTAVIADDTDILVLLLCHWNAFMADIHLWSERKKAQKILLKLVDIREAAKHSVQTVLAAPAKCLSPMIYITLKVVCENILMILLCGLAAAVMS